MGTYAQPVYVTSDPDDPDRLFVVERAGRIQLTTPAGTSEFLDLTARVVTGPDQGLLSIAFPPDYGETGLFYVHFTEAPAGDVILAELSSAGNAADPASLREVLRIPDFTFHSGGQLQFGPDGYLYLSTGDGNAPGDPDGNGQDPTTLLGALLRIDPRQSGADSYTVPVDNPYVGTENAEEVWSWGFRHPWRFSFDRETGALTLGDVGQETWEEINYQPQSEGRGRGENFGWNCREGFMAYSGAPEDCAEAGAFTDPAFAYPNPSQPGCTGAIMGGYVVRDPLLADLYGRYLYGDFCTGDVRSIMLDAPLAQDDRSEALSVPSLVSFGEDADGRVYVASIAGAVCRLVSEGEPTCDDQPIADPPSEDPILEVPSAEDPMFDPPPPDSMPPPPGADPGDGDGWLTLSPSPLERSEVGAAIVGDQLYVVGGFDATGKSTAQMVRYDIPTDRWRKARRLPIAVNHPAVTAHRGHLYLLGGWLDDGEPSDRLYRYNPRRDRWRRLPGAPTARAALALVGIGGRLYAAGGATAKTSEFRGLEVFDLERKQWRKGPPMPTGRNHVGAAVFKGGLVVTGGRTDPVTDLDVVERYHPGRDRWSRLPSLVVPRSGHAAAAPPGMVVVFGGERLSEGVRSRLRPGEGRDTTQLETLADAEAFDPRVGSWSRLPSMPTPRHGLGGAASHGMVFAAAGSPRPGIGPTGTLEALRVAQPPNNLRFVRVNRLKGKGWAWLVIRAPTAGTLRLLGSTRVRRTGPRTVEEARSVRLLVRPKGNARRKLNRVSRSRGFARIRIRARVRFVPKGGEPRVKSRRVSLTMRR